MRNSPNGRFGRVSKIQTHPLTKENRSTSRRGRTPCHENLCSSFTDSFKHGAAGTSTHWQKEIFSQKTNANVVCDSPKKLETLGKHFLFEMTARNFEISPTKFMLRFAHHFAHPSRRVASTGTWNCARTKSRVFSRVGDMTCDMQGHVFFHTHMVVHHAPLHSFVPFSGGVSEFCWKERFPPLASKLFPE